MPKILYHPLAESEVKKFYIWYKERNPTIAKAFLAEIDKALAHIKDNPESWPRYYANTQRYLLKRFPFSIVYRNVNERIDIIAVAHAKRKPVYWVKR